MQNRVLVIFLLMLGVLLCPLPAQGEDPELHWLPRIYGVPEAIHQGDTFGMKILLDVEGNDAAREAYKDAILTVWFNISLSDGLQWKWQSSTQQLDFWMPFPVVETSNLVTPKLEIVGSSIGFHTIRVQITPQLEDQAWELQAQVSVWVSPATLPKPFHKILEAIFEGLIGFLLGVLTILIPARIRKRREG